MSNEGWPWGSTRGGGGDPFRDGSGAIITNLKSAKFLNSPEGKAAVAARSVPPNAYDGELGGSSAKGMSALDRALQVSKANRSMVPEQQQVRHYSSGAI